MRSRKLKFWQLSVIVALMLLAHWFGMHLIVHWVGGEANVARGQSTARSAVPAYQHDDGWRRTSHGWERIEHLTPQPTLAATHHVSWSHIWPAAWAAGVVLLICSVPPQRSAGA